MKIKETSPGKVYALDSMNGCEVMNGNVVVQVPAMTQTIVIANSDCLTSEDDTVTITEVFKLAPALYRQGEDGGNWMKEAYDGLVSIVGADNFKWEFLDNPYRVVVHTNRLDESVLTSVNTLLEDELPQNIEVVQYNHNIEVSWRDINKYAACKNYSDMQAVNPNFRTDLTSEGEWVYTLTALTSSTNVLSNNSSLKKAHLYMPSINGWNAGGALCNCANLTEAYIFAPNIVGIEHTFCACPKLKKVSGELKSVIVGHGAFLNSPIEILEIEFSKLDRAERFAASTNGNSATAPRLNKESALRVLNSIPSFTSGNHPIVLGIHVDHQNDEEVLAAIANAEAKGWTLEVQWNGTPTSQASVTYGLRKPPIYAKVSEMERPDGTTERVLDWGHYVTDPSGYEEFRSVEEAREYFNLPAEEEETIIEEQ